MPREVRAAPAEEWSETELIERLWKTGQLRYLCLPHQLKVYDHFHAWNVGRRDPELQRAWRDAGAHYDRIQVWEIARRWGKTALCLILAIEACIRRPGSRGMLFTGNYSNILGIYVPLAREIFSDAPFNQNGDESQDYRPQFVTASNGNLCGFKIPAVDGFIKLVGVDRNPEATRGQFLDFAIGTEAMKTKDLGYLYRAVISQQFQGRPWAWCVMESSTAIEPDCDFNRDFREDARLRDAYHLYDIRDNTSLSEEEIQQAISEAGGVDSSDCKRELFCIEDRDPKKMVVPEFSEELHCIDPSLCLRPPQAFAYVGMDPGYADMCGIVWFYVDWLQNRIVVEEAYAERNKSTSEIARVIKATEQRLWGSKHRPSMVPQPRASLMDALKPQPAVDVVDETQQLLEIGGSPEVIGGRIENAPSGSLTWWQDATQSHRPNPYKRVSDVAPLELRNLRDDHGLIFEAAKKGPGSKDAHLQHLRMLFGANKILILRNGRTTALIEQLRSGVWNDKGTDWKSTPTLGHLDLIAALSYSVREIDLRRNPFKHGADPRAFDVVVQDAVFRERLRGIFRRSGRDAGKFTRDRGRYYRAVKKSWR